MNEGRPTHVSIGPSKYTNVGGGMYKNVCTNPDSFTPTTDVTEKSASSERYPDISAYLFDTDDMSVLVPAVFLLYTLNITPVVSGEISHDRTEPDIVRDVGANDRTCEEEDSSFVVGSFTIT
jgi:hypothetical protein